MHEDRKYVVRVGAAAPRVFNLIYLFIWSTDFQFCGFLVFLN